MLIFLILNFEINVSFSVFKEIAVRLPAEIWQQMAVQSPESTIYSASTQRSMERRKVLVLSL